MKRLFAAALALSLLTGTVAMADDHRGGNDRSFNDRRHDNNGGRFGNGRGELPRGNYHNDGDGRHDGRRDDHRNDWRRDDRGQNNWRDDHRFDHGRNNWRDDHRSNHGRDDWRNDHRFDHGRNNWRDDHRFDHGRNNWRDDRHDYRDNRFDHRYNGPRYDNRYYGGRYRVGPYYRPYGYYQHSWRRGDRLPSAYYGPRYIVGDYYSYGLRSPPRGCHWVRVNNDVVLAAITTGIVLDIAYNHFY